MKWEKDRGKYEKRSITKQREGNREGRIEKRRWEFALEQCSQHAPFPLDETKNTRENLLSYLTISKHIAQKQLQTHGPGCQRKTRRKGTTCGNVWVWIRLQRTYKACFSSTQCLIKLSLLGYRRHHTLTPFMPRPSRKCTICMGRREWPERRCDRDRRRWSGWGSFDHSAGATCRSQRWESPWYQAVGTAGARWDGGADARYTAVVGGCIRCCSFLSRLKSQPCGRESRRTAACAVAEVWSLPHLTAAASVHRLRF